MKQEDFPSRFFSLPYQLFGEDMIEKCGDVWGMYFLVYCMPTLYECAFFFFFM